MRTVGASNLSKALWFLGAAVVALLVLTWTTPLLQRYEVKTAAKVLCSDMIKFQKEEAFAKRRGGSSKFTDKVVMQNFISRAKQAEARFDAGDFDVDCGDYLNKDEPHCFSYLYEFDKQEAQHVCTIHVRYLSDTQPAVIGQVLQEIPHLKIQHHIKMVEKVNNSF
jgi:hypothetical protein